MIFILAKEAIQRPGPLLAILYNTKTVLIHTPIALNRRPGAGGRLHYCRSRTATKVKSLTLVKTSMSTNIIWEIPEQVYLLLKTLMLGY